MQCKDIQDIPILEFLKKNNCFCTYGKEYAMPSVKNAMPLNTPIKLQLAKMKKLINRGLVDGCYCGCRGDFEITQKGLEILKQNKP